ncbi:hypothetical protein [Klebsiella pneumoniae]
MSDAIQQINFYVNEAASETLRDRQSYLTDAEMQELYAAYRAGVDFFNAWERERAA